MADRVDLVMRLSVLANDATLRGDDRAVSTLKEAVALLLSDQTIDRRREWDRERKRNRRNPVESGGIGGQPVPPPEVFPHTPFPNPLSRVEDDTARERDAADAVYAESVDNLIAMIAERVGDAWPDIDGFLKRRQFQTWKGWIKEMLSILTGGQATATDLALVCRDDAALERPIGSPKGLRTFVGSAVRERVENASRPPTGAGGVGASKPSATEHWTDRKAREEREGAEWNRVRGLVEARKARTDDGEYWWARMKRDAGTTDLRAVYRYAAQHLKENGVAHV